MEELYNFCKMFSFITKDCLNLDYFVYIMCLNIRKAHSDLSGKPKFVQFDEYKQNIVLIPFKIQKHVLRVVSVHFMFQEAKSIFYDT